GAEVAPATALPEHLRAVLAAALRASPRPVEGRRLPHPTDQAVVAGGRDAGVTDTDGRPAWTRVEELPFEPARGLHAVLGRAGAGGRPAGGGVEGLGCGPGGGFRAVLGRDGADHLLSVKGAPEVVLDRCTARLRGGTTTPLTAEQRALLARRATALARSGQRV